MLKGKSRKAKHGLYTKSSLQKKTRVALRTIVSYEKGDSYPRKRETYAALANALDVETNYLLTEDEEFVVNAAERYGTRGSTGPGCN